MHPAKKIVDYMKLDTDRLNWLRLGNEVTEWGNKFSRCVVHHKKMNNDKRLCGWKVHVERDCV